MSAQSSRFSPDALVRSVQNTIPGVLQRNESENASKDPIVKFLSKIKPQIPTEFGTSLDTVSVAEYSKKLSSLVDFLVDGMEENTEVPPVTDTLPPVTVLDALQEPQPQPQTTEQTEQPVWTKEEVEKNLYELCLTIPSLPETKDKKYPDDYLSKVLIESFEKIYKFDLSYGNLTLTGHLNKFLVKMVYSLQFWEVYHLINYLPNLRSFLLLLDFKVYDTSFGALILPPENYLVKAMYQGFQYPFPYPFYNYSYHPLTENINEKYAKIHIKPYVDISLKNNTSYGKKRRKSIITSSRLFKSDLMDPQVPAKKRRGPKKKQVVEEEESDDFEEKNLQRLMRTDALSRVRDRLEEVGALEAPKSRTPQFKKYDPKKAQDTESRGTSFHPGRGKQMKSAPPVINYPPPEPAQLLPNQKIIHYRSHPEDASQQPQQHQASGSADLLNRLQSQPQGPQGPQLPPPPGTQGPHPQDPSPQLPIDPNQHQPNIPPINQMSPMGQHGQLQQPIDPNQPLSSQSPPGPQYPMNFPFGSTPIGSTPNFNYLRTLPPAPMNYQSMYGMPQMYMAPTPYPPQPPQPYMYDNQYPYPVIYQQLPPVQLQVNAPVPEQDKEGTVSVNQGPSQGPSQASTNQNTNQGSTNQGSAIHGVNPETTNHATQPNTPLNPSSSVPQINASLHSRTSTLSPQTIELLNRPRSVNHQGPSKDVSLTLNRSEAYWRQLNNSLPGNGGSVLPNSLGSIPVPDATSEAAIASETGGTEASNSTTTAPINVSASPIPPVSQPSPIKQGNEEREAKEGTEEKEAKEGNEEKEKGERKVSETTQTEPSNVSNMLGVSDSSQLEKSSPVSSNVAPSERSKIEEPIKSLLTGDGSNESVQKPEASDFVSLSSGIPPTQLSSLSNTSPAKLPLTQSPESPIETLNARPVSGTETSRRSSSNAGLVSQYDNEPNPSDENFAAAITARFNSSSSNDPYTGAADSDLSSEEYSDDDGTSNHIIRGDGSGKPKPSAIHQCHLTDPNTHGPCLKIFYGKNELSRHQEFVHASMKKIFKCVYCAKDSKKVQSYPRHDSLARHIRRKHGITGKENRLAVSYAKDHAITIDDPRKTNQLDLLELATTPLPHPDFLAPDFTLKVNHTGFLSFSANERQAKIDNEGDEEPVSVQGFAESQANSALTAKEQTSSEPQQKLQEPSLKVKLTIPAQAMKQAMKQDIKSSQSVGQQPTGKHIEQPVQPAQPAQPVQTVQPGPSGQPGPPGPPGPSVEPSHSAPPGPIQSGQHSPPATAHRMGQTVTLAHAQAEQKVAAQRNQEAPKQDIREFLAEKQGKGELQTDPSLPKFGRYLYSKPKPHPKAGYPASWHNPSFGSQRILSFGKPVPKRSPTLNMSQLNAGGGHGSPQQSSALPSGTPSISPPLPQASTSGSGSPKLATTPVKGRGKGKKKPDQLPKK